MANIHQQEYPIEIDVQSVKSLLESDAPSLLLDCREQDEYDMVRIQGAKHMPMGEIPARVSELEPYCQQRIVVHCHHGGRSLQVTAWLREQGFFTAQNMTGGIDQWSVQINPQLPRY